MTYRTLLAIALLTVLTACGKKADDTAATTQTPAPAEKPIAEQPVAPTTSEAAPRLAVSAWRVLRSDL